MVGRNIEHYKLIQVLGEGGMGIVYKAFDLKLERYIALKILSSHATNNPQFVERFKREAKHQAKLTHANIIPVYGFTEEQGVLGIVMEYVDGEPLEKMIERRGRIPVSEALLIIKQILAGAAYAHKKGFIHRDIKPSNIIINKEGVAKIMDFGISKSLTETKNITKTGTKIGTVLYMSPEQIKAHDPTIQSDIYSIGITFYEMLAGKVPFDFDTEYEIMEAHLKKIPEKLSSVIEEIPPEIDLILSKALNKNPQRRYLSCEEFMDDLNSKITPQVLARKKESKKIGRASTLIPKLKFALVITFIFVVLAGLFLFVYDAVSGFWKGAYTSSKGPVSGEHSYRLNPSYVVKTNWIALPSSTSEDLNSIYMLNDSTGLICGNSGIILKTENAGLSWKQINDSFLTDSLYSLTINNYVAFAVGKNGAILKSTNQGNSWQPANNYNVTESLFDITFIKGTQTGIIVGSRGTILKSKDNGETWHPIQTNVSNLLYGVSFVNNQTGFAVGWDGTILKSTDQGESWILRPKITDNYLRDIEFFDEQTGIIACGGGEILQTNDGGETWTLIDGGVISGLYAVRFLNEKYAMILGSRGEILVSESGGKNWELTSSGNFIALTDLSVTPSGKIFITGFGGTILTSQN
jgi:serine/threonine-protein kinase